MGHTLSLGRRISSPAGSIAVLQLHNGFSQISEIVIIGVVYREMGTDQSRAFTLILNIANIPYNPETSARRRWPRPGFASQSSVICHTSQHVGQYCTDEAQLLVGTMTTDCVSKRGNAISSICPSVCPFVSTTVWTKWPLTLIICMRMGHDHTHPGLKVKVKGQNAVGATSNEGSSSYHRSHSEAFNSSDAEHRSKWSVCMLVSSWWEWEWRWRHGIWSRHLCRRRSCRRRLWAAVGRRHLGQRCQCVGEIRRCHWRVRRRSHLCTFHRSL